MTESEWLASEDPAAMLDWLTESLTGPPTPSDRKLRLWACRATLAYPIHILTDGDMYQAAAVVFRVRAVASAECVADGVTGVFATGQWVCLMPDARTACSELIALIDDAARAPLAAAMRDIIGNPFRPVSLPHAAACPRHVGPKTTRECGCRCNWLTPDVLSLALAAYEERGRECDARPCRNVPWNGCEECHGTGRIGDGTLDPFRLALLADALEDAGCVGERCTHCHGSGTYTVQVTNAGLSAANGYGAATIYSEWRGCRHCGGDWDRKGAGRLPHPILEHLRGPGPHARGCWALDLILGKR